MSRAVVALVGLVACIACAGAGYTYGRSDGKATEVAASNAKTVEDLRGQLAAHAALVKDSGTASRSMRTALAERQKHDDKTSKDFRDALTATADSRAGCVFPTDVMRQLRAARDRAAEAAALGVRGSVPAADADAGEQPR